MEIDALLSRVNRPGRYCANEFNVVRKDWQQARLRLALAFPDLYEIGMSHQGLQILYHLVNARPEWLAERVYAPDIDLEQALRETGMPLFSLESRRPLAEFDVLGISLPYELCYTNILTILDLAGLPLLAKDRREDQPLVLGGGPCAFHPEPVADFFDAILLGDGEEALPEMLTVIQQGREQQLARGQILAALAAVPGVYVPAFFAPRYDAAGKFLGTEALRPDLPPVRRRVLADLEQVDHTAPPLVPATRVVHDRLGVEIARGCTRGCRFCQAGIIYRPVREREPAAVLQEILSKLEQSGFEEVALLSLSSGDYACINELLGQLMDALESRRVSVSLPSMRVGSLTPAMMEQIKRVRKTGFTLAPEAGSDRLRRVINKGITEEDLLAAGRSAFGLGWKLIKLYFMFGLPTETEEDLAAIVELAHKVLKTGPAGRCQVTVSSAVFVPKPHTPFEREPQLSVAEGFERIDFLKQQLRHKKFKLKWHDPRQSYLEGVFCRGDRRLSALVEQAWRDGARLDAWSDHFALERWQTAAAGLNLDLDHYLRRREASEPLPWDHLDAGVSRDFLAAEYQRAISEDYTPDCRVHGCSKCGLCDFKTVKPVVFRRPAADSGAVTDHRAQPGVPELLSGPNYDNSDAVPASRSAPSLPQPERGTGYRLSYSRLDEARFMGHLEVLQVFFRALRRVGWPLAFSRGFNPSPKVSFGPALPLGTESRDEFLWLELTAPLGDLEEARSALSQQLPAGLTVLSLEPGGRQQPPSLLSAYRIRLPGLSEMIDPQTPPALLAAKEFVMTVRRKGADRTLDIRPAVKDFTLQASGDLELVLVQEAGRPTVKPLEVVAAACALAPEQLADARLMKLWTRPAQG
ncbi:TIGR03960 family B12-binding radical SAM protein [Desulfurivibrio dismutans]|uniref:TIGR03960 family B12-binding radical SAM protein n=1 Tax=Desulfurivibrio dismutans TaxID=1398908 RepID=UPI0023D9A597|nr:TIGR03960 family B12-binding radical SAM protein [Desulfurivibrio alkaliphilus]MDF1614690.1 TIGR03960 family B12-binding radical SAM protein [Desulfurivibrio alkaliphilus]